MGQALLWGGSQLPAEAPLCAAEGKGGSREGRHATASSLSFLNARQRGADSGRV